MGMVLDVRPPPMHVEVGKQQHGRQGALRVVRRVDELVRHGEAHRSSHAERDDQPDESEGGARGRGRADDVHDGEEHRVVDEDIILEQISEVGFGVVGKPRRIARRGARVVTRPHVEQRDDDKGVDDSQERVAHGRGHGRQREQQRDHLELGRAEVFLHQEVPGRPAQRARGSGGGGCLRHFRCLTCQPRSLKRSFQVSVPLSDVSTSGSRVSVLATDHRDVQEIYTLARGCRPRRVCDRCSCTRLSKTCTRFFQVFKSDSL